MDFDNRVNIKRAIRQALRHPNAVSMSNAALGRHLGVSDKTVDHYRKEMETTSEIPKTRAIASTTTDLAGRLSVIPA